MKVQAVYLQEEPHPQALLLSINKQSLKKHILDWGQRELLIRSREVLACQLSLLSVIQVLITLVLLTF